MDNETRESLQRKIQRTQDELVMAQSQLQKLEEEEEEENSVYVTVGMRVINTATGQRDWERTVAPEDPNYPGYIQLWRNDGSKTSARPQNLETVKGRNARQNFGGQKVRGYKH